MKENVTVQDILQILDKHENYRIVGDNGYLYTSIFDTIPVQEYIFSKYVKSLSITSEYELDIFIGEEGEDIED